VNHADKKPQGKYGSQREAGYADPGLQSDRQPRYPLKEKGEYSKDRIHAAWSYIHHKDNAGKYDADEVRQIKSRIKRAAETFAEERSKLEGQWSRGDNVSTEDLRLALQRYRSFFDRLLSM
jgi:hypothetical protein